MRESEIDAQRLEKKVIDLRVELKKWERDFESKNARAPSRQDIKENKLISRFR